MKKLEKKKRQCQREEDDQLSNVEFTFQSASHSFFTNHFYVFYFISNVLIKNGYVSKPGESTDSIGSRNQLNHSTIYQTVIILKIQYIIYKIY